MLAWIRKFVAAGRCALCIVTVGSLLAGCAVGPATGARLHTQRPALSQNMFVMTPPVIYVEETAGASASGGVASLHFTAEMLANQISTRLNNAGNNTGTTLATGTGNSLRNIVLERHKATGITEALVVNPRRASFAGGLVRAIEVEAQLYDAKTFTLLWDFTYENKKAGPAIIPEICDALIGALRQSGFVK